MNVKFSERKEYLDQSVRFNRVQHYDEFSYYRLIGTRYSVCVTPHQIVWSTPVKYYIPFEKVFNNVVRDTQKEFINNLDLFV